jgi:hypothetical protein
LPPVLPSDISPTSKPRSELSRLSENGFSAKLKSALEPKRKRRLRLRRQIRTRLTLTVRTRMSHNFQAYLTMVWLRPH